MEMGPKLITELIPRLAFNPPSDMFPESVPELEPLSDLAPKLIRGLIAKLVVN